MWRDLVTVIVKLPKLRFLRNRNWSGRTATGRPRLVVFTTKFLRFSVSKKVNIFLTGFRHRMIGDGAFVKVSWRGCVVVV